MGDKKQLLRVGAIHIEGEVPVPTKMTCMKKYVADMNVSFEREFYEISFCSVEC